MRLNRVCNIEHWDEPELAQGMRQMIPYLVEEFPTYPTGREHRKAWEFAQIINGLRHLGALSEDSWVLSVGAGHEEPMYFLTNEVRWVFATDLYGDTSFSNREANASVLIDAGHFARIPYNPRRLVVQHMDALELRYEDNTFHAAYSLSSIEHFGGMQGAVGSLREFHRVLRPGGVAAVATEVGVNRAPQWSEPGLELFTPEAIMELDPPLLPISWEKINDVWYNYVKGHNPYEYFGVYDVVRLDTVWLDKA